MKTAYYNASVYTGNTPLRHAFIVEDGRFTYVGDNDEILSLASSNDSRVDLNGCFVCPGFNDSHMHLLGFGDSLGTAQLANHTGSLEELLEYMRSFLSGCTLHCGQWLSGRGWNQDLFSDTHRMPNRYDLDTISRDIPIILTRACGHCCIVNSKALELAGIGPDTPAPEGGSIGYEDGKADGRLFDNAIELIHRMRPVPSTHDIQDMLLRACKTVNRYGITSVQTDDYQVFPGISWNQINEAYNTLSDRGDLSLRVYEQAQFTNPDELLHFIDSGCKTGTGNNMFRIGPVKLLGDGSLGSRTAYLSRPYADSSMNRGFPLFSADQMNAMIMCAHENDMQLAVHAIGDACLDQVLNGIEQALKIKPRCDHRHGIVHCQITRPDQLERIRDLHLHVYAQSIFLDYDNHIVAKRVGTELASSSYNWKTLMNQGISVSNGSDCPVELPDVMAGIQCAVTRRSLDGTGLYLPDQAFTVKEALDSFSIRGAEASFEEKVKGKIFPGYLADFVVLSENPFDADPFLISQIPVAACFVGGKCVYEK